MLNVFSLVPRPPLFYSLLRFQSEEYVFLGPGTLCKLRGCAIVSEHQSNLVIILRGIMKLMYQNKFLNMQTMVVMTWNTKGRPMNIWMLLYWPIKLSGVTWCLVKITATYTHTICTQVVPHTELFENGLVFCDRMWQCENGEAHVVLEMNSRK